MAAPMCGACCGAMAAVGICFVPVLVAMLIATAALAWSRGECAHHVECRAAGAWTDHLSAWRPQSSAPPQWAKPITVEGAHKWHPSAEGPLVTAAAMAAQLFAAHVFGP